MKFDCSKNNKDFEYLAFELNQFFLKINSLSRKTDFNMMCSLINTNLLKIYQIEEIYLNSFFENKNKFSGEKGEEFYDISYRSFYLWSMVQEYFYFRKMRKPIGKIKKEILEFMNVIGEDLKELVKMWKKRNKAILN